MAANAEDVIAALRSIDASLKTLVQLSQARAGAARPATSPATSAPATRPAPAVAPDTDLDGEYGNPVIKAKDPRDWSGPTMNGRRLSECPAEYLDLLAARYDYFADQQELSNEQTTSGKPRAPYTRREAARARGWARRLRAGWKPPVVEDAGAAMGFPSDNMFPGDAVEGDVF
jgi:hypothetical protein